MWERRLGYRMKKRRGSNREGWKEEKRAVREESEDEMDTREEIRKREKGR